MARRQTAKTALAEDTSTAEPVMEAVPLAPTSKSNSSEADLRVGVTSKNFSKEDKHKESETAAVVGRVIDQKVSSVGDVEKKQGPIPQPARNSCNVEALGELAMCEFVYC